MCDEQHPTLSRLELQDFLERLLEVERAAVRFRAGVLEVVMGCGICAHATYFIGEGDAPYDLYAELARRAQGWEWFSGDEVFPVPGVRGLDPLAAYYAEDVCSWTGEYGDLRMSLLSFLIDSVRKDLGEQA